jgi:acetylglutamate kinase
VKEIDYGYVGDVKEVRAGLLASLIGQDLAPVLAPLTHDKQGQLLNTNADTIAGEVAKALAGYFDITLIYCFEKKGVLMDANDENSLIDSLDRDTFERYTRQGIIQGGMIPKLTNAFEAIEAGVKQVVITQASEIHTGRGTYIH